ncbi:S-layer homology domain-containing protein [Neofamilia massiliensis]|uniref:S-layer homology domain-containing protein n=1 Tax=Neofamilia massiliensis TaxID=1673724 RepID=UPI00096AD33E|nr:S-layer homology domain-containing protein [Neofamilia massiliensis]
MKRKICLLLAVIMLLGVMPVNVFAQEPEPNVTLVGQWINDSSKKEDTPKHYELTDKIGYPLYNSGLLRGLAKQFLGWSDKALVANGVLAEGAKLFSPEDTIADVFGSSIPKYAKIYAVYYEINKPYGDPFPQDPLSQLALGAILENLKERINSNTVLINNSVKPENILKDTKNNKVDDAKDELKIIDDYKKTDDDKTINEVVLSSEFEMDWVVAMLAYRNIAGSNAIRPILSYDYQERYEQNNFPTDEGKDAEYTYVDLNMDFGEDEGLVVPDQLFLEFKSYSWRPLYAFGIKDDGSKDVLNNLDDYKTLVSNSDPITKFSVNTKYKSADGEDKNYRKITVRVVLRQWNPNDKDTNRGFTGERIPEFSIPKGPEGTVASEILSNMTLRVLGSADGIENKNIVRITDAKAKALADGDAKESIEIKGSIQGHVFASAGTVNWGKLSVPLSSDLAIKESEAEKVLKLSYVHKKPDPKPDPKPQPEEAKENYVPYFLIFGNNEEPKTEDHIAYIYGYEDQTVRAESNLTRAEAAAMVTRLAKLDVSNKTMPAYKDLEENAWYLGNINAALKAGMIDDIDGYLRPNEKITRAEFAKMIAAIDKDNDHVSNFPDIKGHKYEREINKIDGNKRIQGFEDGTFRPDDFLTRAEAATFLNRIFNRLADEISIENFRYSIIDFKDLSQSDWFYYEIVEASNSHEFIRRNKTDKYDRVYENWTKLLNF